MQQRHSPEIGPLLAGAGDDLVEAGHDVFHVGLVLEVGHPGSTIGVVAGRTGERHDRPTRREHGPGRREFDGQRTLVEAGPGVAAVGWLHRLIVEPTVGAPLHNPTTARGDHHAPSPLTTLATVIGPEEDPHDDDWGAPPPELVDRMWRHPSEIAAAHRLAAEAERAAIVQRRRTLALSAAGGFALTCGVLIVGVQALERDPESIAPIRLGITATNDTALAPAPAPAPVSAAATVAVVDPPTIEGPSTASVASVAIDDEAGATVATLVHPDDATSLASIRVGDVERTCVQMTERHAAMALDGIDLRTGDSVTGPDGPMLIVHVDRDRGIAVLAGAAATPISLTAIGMGDTVVSMTADGLRSGEIIDLTADVETSRGRIRGAMLTNITAIATEHAAIVTDGSGNIVGLTLDTEHTLVAAVPVEVIARVVDGVEAERLPIGWVVEADEFGPTVTAVEPDGPAATAGIQVGDHVEYIDGHPIGDLLDLRERLGQASDDGEIELLVRRDGDGAKRTRHRLVIRLETDSPA